VSLCDLETLWQEKKTATNGTSRMSGDTNTLSFTSQIPIYRKS